MKKEKEFIPGEVYYKGYNLEQALQSVGAGWAGLLREIFDKMETLGTHMVIYQVKEKYGGLRVYSGAINDEFDKFLMDIERKSFTICELCGADAALRRPLGNTGWYQTLCDVHANGREPITPF